MAGEIDRGTTFVDAVTPVTAAELHRLIELATINHQLINAKTIRPVTAGGDYTLVWHDSQLWKVPLSALLPLASVTEAQLANGSVTIPKLAFPFTGRNLMVNGNFQVWPEGFSLSTPASFSYGPEMFRVQHDGTIGTFTLSRQNLSQAERAVVPGSYFLRWAQTVAGSGSTARQITGFVEGLRRFQAKELTFSFYAKADAARTVTLNTAINYGTGGSPSAPEAMGSLACNLTTDWQRFTRTVTVPDFVGKTFGTNGEETEHVFFSLALPLNTLMTIDIAAVQIEEGGEATPFEVLPLGEVQAACERYFFRVGHIVEISTLRQTIMYPQLMRVVPSISGGGAGFTASDPGRRSATPWQTTRAFQLLAFSARF